MILLALAGACVYERTWSWTLDDVRLVETERVERDGPKFTRRLVSTKVNADVVPSAGEPAAWEGRWFAGKTPITLEERFDALIDALEANPRTPVLIEDASDRLFLKGSATFAGKPPRLARVTLAGRSVRLPDSTERGDLVVTQRLSPDPK